MSSHPGAALRTTLSASHTTVERIELTSIDSQNAATAFVTAAFDQPLDIDGKPGGPIPKATLVVGAGKGERAKYSEDLPKWVTTALKDIGYVEDRGASALEACAGFYKYQHDTGQNLKYVHVFPRVNRTQPGGAEDGEGAQQEEVLTGADAAEKLCLVSELKTFVDICESKIKPWVCKKRLMKFLQDNHDKLVAIEEKLAKMVKLEPQEQKLFDATDKESIEKKMEWLRAEMISMIDDGHLTKKERELALEQVRSKLKELEASKAPAPRLEALKARIALIEKSQSEPGFRHPLKHEARLKILWAKSLAMEPLAEKAGPKGRWSPKLSAEEVAALGEKEDMDAECGALVRACRFWFEEEEELEERAKQAKSTVKASKRFENKTMSKGITSNSTWATVSSSKPKSSSQGLKKAAPSKPGNAFGALNDSDSDD